MGKVLALSNGRRVLRDETSPPAIYDQIVEVVSGTPANDNEIQYPVNATNPITLPDSRTYEGLELEVYYNGQPLSYLEDYTFHGSSPYSAIALTFNVDEVGDIIRFRIARAP